MVKTKNISFAIFEGKKCLAAICLGVSRYGHNDYELSFGNTYCPEPIFNKTIGVYELRKIKKHLFSVINNVFYFVENEVKEDFTSSSRQITTSLYYLSSAIFLIEEGNYCEDLAYRSKISELIIKYKISGIIVSIIMPGLNPLSVSTLNAILTRIIGFSLFFALRYLFQKKRNVEALGMGDVYLIAGLGVWLGFEKFLYILSISSFLGIFYYLLVGKKEENFEIPYGSA